MNYSDIKLQTGDIFLTDDFSIQSKIVKFLMRAPTLWQYLWRALRGTLEEVRFYHAGIVISSTQIIEQQEDVRVRNVDVIFKNNKNFVIWRKINLTSLERLRLHAVALSDLNKGYDIILCFGKFIDWILGTKIFARIIQEKEKEICVTRVAKWYLNAIGETFGCKSWHNVTTKIIDEYCLAHPNEWEQVVIKGSK